MSQLELFKNDLVPEIARKKPTRTLRILSAPCSSGEEPYTIGMLLDEVATSLAGLYPRSAFRATDGKYLSKYLTPRGDHYPVGNRLAGRVKFKQGNQRNLLIYFDKPTQKRLVEAFHRAMVPGGYLLIGHSESLLSLEVDFMLRSNKQAIYYEGIAPGQEVLHG
jgi:chemotaxis protein methyltransferase CheR